MPSVPRLATAYYPLYRPGGDRFCGPDTKYLREGQWYDDWMPNDHTFIQGPDGRWHAFGITCPASPAVHDGEFSGFHIEGPDRIVPGEGMAALWREHAKILPPRERPGEPIWFWAPFVIERDGLYHMFYGPGDMRLAVSEDLFHWSPRGTIFRQDGTPRDPCVQRIEDVYVMVYVAGESIWARRSDDLLQWSEGREIFTLPVKASPESPFLLPFEGHYYLFYCIWDGTNGNYDNRTSVLYSSDPLDFAHAPVVARLAAHAPEVIRNQDKWYLSSAEWPMRGLSVAEMVFHTESVEIS